MFSDIASAEAGLPISPPISLRSRAPLGLMIWLGFGLGLGLGSGLGLGLAHDLCELRIGLNSLLANCLLPTTYCALLTTYNPPPTLHLFLTSYYLPC